MKGLGSCSPLSAPAFRTDGHSPIGGESVRRPLSDTVSGVSGQTVRPRLLNLKGAAAYLGVSYWSVRDYCLQGLIPVVQLPPLRAKAGDRQKANLRRVLIDVQDLNAFISDRKRHGLDTCN